MVKVFVLIILILFCKGTTYKRKTQLFFILFYYYPYAKIYTLFPTQFPHYLYTLYRFFYIMDTEDIRPMK